MKKNMMMRTASILLLGVLLTTSAISGTFAKYTTSQTATDSARVAYWGFEQNDALTFNLFNSSYDGTVLSSKAGEKVIAPGTSSAAAFTFAYTDNENKGITAPEVDYTISLEPEITVNGSNNADAFKVFDENPNFIWTLKSANGTVKTCNTVEALKDAIVALTKDDSGNAVTYEAGQLPEALGGECKIGWEWKFEADDDAKKTEQNAYDTALGNADVLDKVEVTIAITATQVN